MEYYEILMKGYINESRITMCEKKEFSFLPSGITRLLVGIKDQAELYGLLTKIRDLGVPLIKLEQVKPDPR